MNIHTRRTKTGRNYFLKAGDIVYLYSGGRNRYTVTVIKNDGFEAIKEGDDKKSFHTWDDIKRWGNKKAEAFSLNA